MAHMICLVLKQKTPSDGYILGVNSPRGRSPRGEFTLKIYPSRGVFCFNPMLSSYMSKNLMLLWAKNHVFDSFNSRDLVMTQHPEESLFCFDQSQCSIAARRWINSESLFGPFTCRFTLLGRLKIP